MSAAFDFSGAFQKLLNFLDKNWKDFKQDFNKKNSSQKDEIVLGFSAKNNSKIYNSDYNQDFEQIKYQLQSAQKFNQLEFDIKQNITNSDNQKAALNILQTYKEAEPLAEKLTGSAKEISALFSDAIQKMIGGTEDFGSSMKKLLKDLESYILKAAADAVIKGFINSVTGTKISDIALGIADSNSPFENGENINFLFQSVSSLFSKHHSGGYIPQGTGNFALPGTSEYLTVLKGGERVLSPAENNAYNQESFQNKQNVVVNNFNVQAWDSKDVQQYLLENKNILAGITADNIKYNNSNLRYMISGI